MNENRPTPRHVIVKFKKLKTDFPEGGKKFSYKQSRTRIALGLLIATLETKRE